MIAGVDGYTRHRWILATDTGHGRTTLELVDSFGALLLREELTLIVIDVPIGLMEAGYRECDKVARSLVRQRRSTVYPAPIRSMLGALDYEDACRRRYAVEEKKCSLQLFAILPIVQNVDAQLVPQLQSRVREGHPEVSFTFLNAGVPMRHPKKVAEGRNERLSLLEPHFPDIREQIAHLDRPDAKTDVMDAYVLLWTARRIIKGTATSIPEKPQYDLRGLRAEIIA